MELIVAIDRHGAIGRKGDLLYHISADLRRFKALTWGHTVVMGRRTFESLPKGALPGRRNIVITRNRDYEATGADIAHSLDEALEMAEGKIFIIGGAEIYRHAMPYATTLHLTVIDAVAEDADTFLRLPDLQAYRVTAVEVPETSPRCRFITLNKI